jgi:hypothetical protein
MGYTAVGLAGIGLVGIAQPKEAVFARGSAFRESE